MADKYQDLPDIDHESQDVFESSDIESDLDISASQTTVQNEEDSDIDQSTFSSKDAKKRFANDHLVGEVDIVNFLGDISKKSLFKNGYKVTAIDETIEQKLARIKRELEEIQLIKSKEEVEQSDQEPSEIDNLVSLLEELSVSDRKHEEINYYNQRIKEIFSNIKVDTSEEQRNSKTDPVESSSANILLLESKLNTIENLLGSESLQQLQNSIHKPRNKTIQNHLNDLTRKINIIYNPEFQLNKIKQEIRDLNKETERLATNRKLALITSKSNNKYDQIQQTQQSRSTFEQKVNSLYDRIDEFDNVNAILPSLLARLKSLHKIHADIGQTVSTVNGIDQVLESMKMDMSKWNESLDKVNQDLDNRRSIFEINKKEIEDRLNQVSNKVDLLNKTS
ncbi:hypothetical protein HYPBUDRAFT_137889 [Hyphopichia burtonii NRRL Y-1933]|uniref:Uncharacterized protein n=1 Tax=Hyphopichia burtonii NRRL Y-1933 TaxID=984485 RepID=A0A1E4RLF5_9ASCO|nr:hypothetical protein HYPBUDRAFT_137889 [Hyphopichia burtonii NRRL Y-1933]ODV67945.1 hypothetical protein HYPBUDRAFT_137889 [Hyphopichia burtonii NRRL Y-1933]